MPIAPVTPLPLTLGQQISLAGDPHPWTVHAVTEHFTALTRIITDADRADWLDARWDNNPDDDRLDSEMFYTVLDWRNGVRGPCNLVGQAWGDGTYTETECAAMLAEFEAGDLEVSHRNRVRIEFGEVA